MRVHDLERLYDYGYWANGKLFSVIERLTPEEFTRSVAGSYGSVRNTLVHALSAEWGWMERCGGGAARGPRLDPADFPTFESLRAAWGPVERDMRRFLAGLGDGELEREVEFQFPGSAGGSLPVWKLLQHGAIHGVHYRAQAALLLRTLGHAPGNVDLLYYDAERSGSRQAAG